MIDCNHSRSYQTKKDETITAIDNDYGDLIVADFNFDKKDDFAIIRDSGGNGGPLYAKNSNFTTEAQPPERESQINDAGTACAEISLPFAKLTCTFTIAPGPGTCARALAGISFGKYDVFP